MMSNRTSLTKTEKQPFFRRLGLSLGTLEIVIRLPISIQLRRPAELTTCDVALPRDDVLVLG